jgi:hypothetical protein
MARKHDDLGLGHGSYLIPHVGGHLTPNAAVTAVVAVIFYFLYFSQYPGSKREHHNHEGRAHEEG